MNPLPAVLIICERDILLREALRNFILASGYFEVEVSATVREALTRLRYKCYGHVLIGVSRPFLRGRRLAAVAHRRQADARIFFLVSAEDQPFFKDPSFECVIKEYVFSTLLELM